MFQIITKISRWFLNKPVQYQANGAEEWLMTHTNYTVLTTKSPRNIFSKILSIQASSIIEDPPIDQTELEKLFPQIQGEWIVGIGGGRIMDASKYCAMKLKKKLCLIPTVLSTTSWLNMAIALRKESKFYFPGTLHANQIIVDPKLIIKAPKSLSLGGLADILCAGSAVTDWELGHIRVEEKISTAGIQRFKEFVTTTINSINKLQPFTEDSIAFIYERFLTGLALCGGSFSGRPVEGGEHFLYYCLDEFHPGKYPHGEIIALNTLIMLKLQQEKAFISPEQMKKFFDTIGIEYKAMLQDQNFANMKDTLMQVKKYVIAKKYPYSILNESIQLDSVADINSILEWLR